jgi:hypothetical protein
LSGKSLRYSIRVNGPWCITFEWQDTTDGRQFEKHRDEGASCSPPDRAVAHRRATG